ncbi:MAG: hypothetical protein OHK0023_21510 [Anaerolineae bacterium]
MSNAPVVSIDALLNLVDTIQSSFSSLLEGLEPKNLQTDSAEGGWDIPHIMSHVIGSLNDMVSMMQAVSLGITSFNLIPGNTFWREEFAQADAQLFMRELELAVSRNKEALARFDPVHFQVQVHLPFGHFLFGDMMMFNYGKHILGDHLNQLKTALSSKPIEANSSQD